MRITNDAEAEQFLDSLINYERVPATGNRYNTRTFDLRNFRRLLEQLGEPQRQFSVIHVAGTKGKGSTCAFLHSIFNASGVRSGLYTSPHISNYRERIVVNGKPIAEKAFCQILSRLAERSYSRQPRARAANFRTVFELLTATAFAHFAQQGVDIAVIETGLGGRLDATNVFDEPAIAPMPVLIDLITTIAFDHTEILGETITKIAWEKAGIIQPHAVTVLAPQTHQWSSDVETMILARAGQMGSPLLRADDVVRVEPAQAARSPTLPEHTFYCDLNALHRWILGNLSFDTFTTRVASELVSEALAQGLVLTPSLPGIHQVENLRGVLATLLVLEQFGWEIQPDAIQKGTQTTEWPGRFDILSRKPPVIVDGAHCVISTVALAETFLARFGDIPVVLVMGVMRDKAAQAMCEALHSRLKIKAAIAVELDSPRALPAEEVATIMSRTLRLRASHAADLDQAVAVAMRARPADGAIVAMGSMYLVGPMRNAYTRAFAD